MTIVKKLQLAWVNPLAIGIVYRFTMLIGQYNRMASEPICRFASHLTAVMAADLLSLTNPIQ